MPWSKAPEGNFPGYSPTPPLRGTALLTRSNAPMVPLQTAEHCWLLRVGMSLLLHQFHPFHHSSFSLDSRSSMREVRKNAAVAPLHALVTYSKVQIDVPLPWAACGTPHGTTDVVFCLPLRSGHTV